MQRHRWIEFSGRFYLQLLRLYPPGYREAYESEMFRFFAQQCREAYEKHGGFGILLLWPRTLVDVGATVIHEHLMDPEARMGLLDIRPDSPLPWKGVLLVMIPGLIFFVSQVEQLTSTNDWFFIAFYRAAFYLLPPVLLVWLLTRRFPIWGLIPLGLLYKLLSSFPPRYLLGKIPFFSRLRVMEADPYNPAGPLVDPNYLISLAACTILLSALIWYTTRHRQIPRAAWRWMALYGLLVLFQIAVQAYQVVARQGLEWSTALDDSFIQHYMVQMPFWSLYEWLPLLVLIFVGALFARKYGGLSFLLLLGYLLPTIVFGRYGEWNEALPFYLVSTALLVYRFIVALVAPVWLVRAASIPNRQRAAAIPVAVAILTHIALTVVAYVAGTNLSGYHPSLLDFAMVISPQVITAVGLGLAVALYIPKERADISPLVLAVD